MGRSPPTRPSANGPFRAVTCTHRFPRPSAWADGTGPSGRDPHPQPTSPEAGRDDGPRSPAPPAQPPGRVLHELEHRPLLVDGVDLVPRPQVEDLPLAELPQAAAPEPVAARHPP